MFKKNPAKKSDLLDVILAFLVAFVIYQGAAFALNTDMPIVAVVSDSMVPTLNRGDLVVASGGDINVGDIIIYSGPRSYPIIHRVVGVENESGITGYITKGDNNPSEDPWIVTRDEIHGKLLFWVPFLGYPRVLLHDLIGI